MLRALWRVSLWIITGLLFISVAYANPLPVHGAWYLVRPYDHQLITHQSLASPPFVKDPLQQQYAPVQSMRLTGGHYLYLAPFEVHEKQSYVFDFKNTSTIEYFRHQVYDQQGRQVAVMEGGIGSRVKPPFFLRHGRQVVLSPGKYTLATQVISTNYLAIPEPYLDIEQEYVQSIKAGNALTLFGLGIFFGLGIYYAALATSRNRWVEAMYAVFIAGNFLFNGAALLVFSDIFDLHSIYFVSMPVLVSSMAYVVFAMHLLEINRYQHKWLYYIGIMLLLVMAVLLLLAILLPNWALEFCRYEVALFLCYGMAAAIRQSQRNNPTAKRYLIAISLFFVCGILAISLSSLDHQFTWYIEHLGLFSVAIEVILLALVLAYQFSRLQQEKEDALQALEMTEKMASSDALTSLPNRYALVKAMERLAMYGSLTFIDLDGLKFYNDTYGHARGDELLICFAATCQRYLGSSHVLYRLGGDEFAVLSHKGEVAVVEQALQDAVQHMRKTGFKFSGASAGSVYHYEADNISGLMRLADMRMYQHKRSRQQAESVQ